MKIFGSLGCGIMKRLEVVHLYLTASACFPDLNLRRVLYEIGKKEMQMQLPSHVSRELRVCGCIK